MWAFESPGGVFARISCVSKSLHCRLQMCHRGYPARSSDQTHYFNCPYQLGSGSLPVEAAGFAVSMGLGPGDHTSKKDPEARAKDFACQAPDFIRVRVRTGDLASGSG